ncbi:hypothetical protein HMPREF9120_00537 [Neisseria sp. oral taxon 020 str. F0370]|nr:hypothetical protein HMPREF9120_00537 [Neisseria sp. oral taxon 020 str. F0370]
MQGKKHSKVGHLASIFDAAGGIFTKKHRRKADCHKNTAAMLIVNRP